MNIGLIKRGESVVVDANIIIYAIQRESEQCKKFLLRCADNDISGVLPVHILSEVMHILMIAEARDNGWITGVNPAKQLAEKPERIKNLYRYENLIKDLLAISLNIVSLENEDFLVAMRIQRETGLLTNDALLIAVAERLRIHAIASGDKGFNSIRLQLLYEPEDSFIDVQVDLMLASSVYQLQAISRRVSVHLPTLDFKVDVLSCEDLILHKLAAGRIIDMADAATLLKVNFKSLDTKYLAEQVAIQQLEKEWRQIWNEVMPDRPAPK